MPTNVLTSDRTSAPASTAARAVAVMSVTFGESFTISRHRRSSRRTAATSSCSRLASVPNCIPSATFGQLTFSSMPAISGTSSSRRQTVT